jgi:hypothetical protein
VLVPGGTSAYWHTTKSLGRFLGPGPYLTVPRSPLGSVPGTSTGAQEIRAELAAPSDGGARDRHPHREVGMPMRRQVRRADYGNTEGSILTYIDPTWQAPASGKPLARDSTMLIWKVITWLAPNVGA